MCINQRSIKKRFSRKLTGGATTAVAVNPVYDTPAHMQHKWSSHTYFWQFIGNQMNFVLAMFFGGSGLLHILVTMKQHKSLVLTSQYRHATGTVLRQFSTTKLLPWHTAASKFCTMQLVHTLIYLSFGYKQV